MFKRLLDFLGALVGLILFSPFILLIVVLVKLDSPGPVLFVQKRLGKDCKEFSLYKFRTMVEKAEQMGTGLYSFEDDDRITRTGKYLRLVSLDEVPQLINLLNGTMSLVGPRPPVTYELGDVSEFTDYMKIRFQVKPGITGPAQVSGRNDLTWDDKVVHDNRYVERFSKWGVLYDIIILIQTVWVVLRFRNVIESKPEETK